MSDEVIFEYNDGSRKVRPATHKMLYGVYVLFNDADAEPLGIENVIDFEAQAEVFFLVDAEGRRWFLPHRSYRWVEITPMEAL